MEEYNNILVENRGNVGIITINRPQVLNAINLEALNEIAYQLQTWEYDDNIRVVILKGGEKAFAAGIDVQELSAEIANKSFAMNVWYEEFRKIEAFTKPLIAAVNGYALGLGCELALVCDIILAADNARFGQPELSLGVLPGFGACSRLVKTLGKAKTMEAILTGKAITAEEALANGMISRIVNYADLEEESLKVAMRIAAQPYQAVINAKETIKQVNNMNLQNGLELESKSCKLSLNSSEFTDSLARIK